MQEPNTTFRHQLAYQAVVECRIEHEYFNDGPCRAIDITPTPATAAKLGGLGLVFRRLSDGFLLIADTGRDWSNPVRQRPEVFEFAFRATDPQFLRYTDLPYRAGQFHVLDALAGTDGSLHPGPCVDDATLAETDTDGIGGVIRIHHRTDAPILPAPDTNPSGPAPGPRLHRIRFQARQAFLRYIFLHKHSSAADSDNYFIENFEVNDALYMFTGPCVVEPRGGRAGFDIRSTQPLPMRRFYAARGILRRHRVDGLPFEYRRTLPMPRPENVVLDPLNRTFICEMLVNL